MNDVNFSMEVFPPKGNVVWEDVYNVLQQFAILKPDYISVTYGAGGSTQGLTAEISSYIENTLGIPSVAHLTCVGTTTDNINYTLNQFKEAGIKRILALRGDLPENHILGDFKHATDLIKSINCFGGFDVFAACYPEGHSESKSFDFDIEVAKLKSDLGIKRFISQMFFDNTEFYRMMDAFEKAGIKTPVCAGIMPITNVKQILHIVKLSGAKLPAALTKMVARFENNPVAFYQAGINYAVQQITELVANGVEGIHLYSMNKPKTAEDIYRNIGVIL